MKNFTKSALLAIALLIFSNFANAQSTSPFATGNTSFGVSVFEVYPNPVAAGDEINVRLEGDSPKTLYFVNFAGQLIKTEKVSGGNQAFGFSTDGMPKGLYLLKIASEDKVETHRFTVK